MKYTIIAFIRALGLLPQADSLKYMQHRVLSSGRNRRFRRAHQGFAVPPPTLAFDAYNHVDWHAYHDSGLRHAGVFARIIDAHAPASAERLAVLEWGCGPGRLIRHLRALLPDRALDLSGTDYNPDTIAWCQKALPDIAFALNGLLPPLPFDDDTFDAAYNFSVFTHLGAETQVAWAKELHRVVKPGGVLVSTTHGDHYRYLLVTKEEHRRFARGEVVVQGRYSEGKKWYFAIHPDAFVENTLLAGFAEVRKHPVQAEDQLLQDVWIARKAAARA